MENRVKEGNAMAESKNNHWRELCAAAAKEEDPKKLSLLVRQIVKALDERTPHSDTSDSAQAPRNAA